MAIIDVLLPVKNGIEFLAEAIESICNQTYSDWRLLILDHGSDDGSLELAYTYAAKDSRIHVHLLPHAIGLSGLLNAGLDLCNCKYIMRQDADDVSMHVRMEIMINAFERDPDLTLAGSLGEIINAQGELIGQMDMPLGEHALKACSFFRTPVAHPTVFMRFSHIKQMNARYGTDFTSSLTQADRMTVPGLAEDYFLFGQLALTSKCLNLNDSLIKYRWHGNNVGATKHLDQMKVALAISRYFVSNIAYLHQLEKFDPAPFCTHGEKLFSISSQSDYAQSDFSDAYRKLSAVLTKLVPASACLDRELAFRKVLSSRVRTIMLCRYLVFIFKHGIVSPELNAVKSWLVHPIKKQPLITIDLEHYS